MISRILELTGLKKPIETDSKADTDTPARIGERAAAYKDATIKLKSGQRLRAIAVDFDDQGARLRFQGHQSWTGDVLVSINGFCNFRTARVAWHDGTDVGLQFVEEAV
ncbi:MAG: hypothetical protein AAF683_09475 [Pseudomonadota bacterium]